MYDALRPIPIPGRHNGVTGPPSRPRIALYSHDTQGLGHVRRNLLVATALSLPEHSPVILLLSGVHEAAGFAMPDGVDCLTLPSLGKNTQGGYHARTLGVPMDELLSLRGRTMLAALRSFQPDLFVVDKVPAGALGELLPVLDALVAEGRTRCVLGLREILDEPDAVRSEWRRDGLKEIIERYYDRIWIYGDPAVYDTAKEYAFPPEIVERIRYTGYLDPGSMTTGAEDGDTSGDRTLADLHLPAGRLALCVVGGGRDGVPLAEAFLGAELPAGTSGLLVTGPLMPREAMIRLETLTAGNARMRMIEFVTDPTSLMRCADRIIAMGGYNTMCEIVSMNKRALIVPRTTPRTEQLIRAERFSRLGLVDMLHPRDLGPAAVSSWLAEEQGAPPVARDVIDLGGTERLHELMAEVLGASGETVEPLHVTG